MAKNYSIGQNRSVSVKKIGGDLHVTIAEEGSDVKTVTFPSQRWGQFMEVLSQVDEAVNQLITKQYVQLNLHLGGKCYISVTTGFACVDIREYYFNRATKEVKPCKKGIALRISEWVALKDVVQQLNKKHAVLANARPCTYQSDHNNLEGALNCIECHPFHYDELFYSLTA
jgi:Transcriptional Coactivator p15 (PC4)